MNPRGELLVERETSDEDKKQEKGKPSQTFWDFVREDPEGASVFIKNLLAGIEPYANKLLNWKNAEHEHELRLERSVSRFSAVVLGIALAGTFAFGILIGVLVYYHSVSPDSLLFYVGIVMGFLLSLIRKQIPSFGNDAEDDEL